MSDHLTTTQLQAADPGVLAARVTELRQETFALIDAMHDGSLEANPAFASAAVGLHAAANALGEAQRELNAADRPSQEAAIVLSLAATALPFTSSPAEEAECWLRALRVDGGVAKALESLGVGEMSLEQGSPDDPSLPRQPAPDGASADVADRAADFARKRAASVFTTLDVLFALFERYDLLIDRALYERGITREQLLARVVEQEAAVMPTAPLGALRN